jgi:hypothetical protein
MSERAVELALANIYLDTTPRESIVEIGAVTPYYWPYRVKDICDPTDEHRLVNIRAGYDQVRFPGKAILSMSTFEHIGQPEYGLAGDPQLNRKAFQKLFAESPNFLVTVPGGFNSIMDDYLLELDAKADGLAVYHLQRMQGNLWGERADVAKPDLRYAYGAYNLFVLSRNSFLEHLASS